MVLTAYMAHQEAHSISNHYIYKQQIAKYQHYNTAQLNHIVFVTITKLVDFDKYGVDNANTL
jgi:hypothetical protein